MVLGIGIRTIWIAIRGANYTDRAFRQVGRNVDKLIKQQQMIRQQSVAMLSAGLMWTVFGAMVIGSLVAIMNQSRAGQRIIQRFTKQTAKFMETWGTVITRTIGPVLTAIGNLLELLSRSPVFAQFLTAAMLIVGGLLLMKGTALIAKGAFDMLMLTMVNAGVVSVGTSMQIAMGFNMIQAAMGPVMVFFMLFYNLIIALRGNIPVLIGVIAGLTIAFLILAKVLWSAATAMSIMTLGAAAVIGLAAAVAAAAMTPTPSYQVGTRVIPRTMPAILHEGEVVFNPRRGLPTTVEREMEGGKRRGFPITRQNITIHIGTVYTKADKDTLHREIARALREDLENKVGA